MQGERFGEELFHRHARIERCVRVLKDNLDFAPESPQLPFTEIENIAAREANLTGGRLDQPQDQASDRGFAAARFPDKRQRLPGLQREIDTVNRFHRRGR